MKLLLTGATGFLGGHMAQRMSREGLDLRCLVRPTSDCSILEELGAEVFRGDITDRRSLDQATKDVDAVVHLAAYYTFYGKKELYDRINVRGTKDLVESALGNGVTRFLHCSSTEAIGPVTDPPGNEDSRPNPTYDYGRSKLASEKVIESFGDSGLEYTILRPSGIYGPRNVDDISYWTITSYAKNVLGTRFFIGSGKNYVQFCHVSDVVEGFMLALRDAKTSSKRTYIVSDERAYTYEDVYGILSDITGRGIPSFHVPTSMAKLMVLPIQTINRLAGRYSFLYNTSTVDSVSSDRSYSIDRIKSELGFRPKYDLRSGLEETVFWYKGNGHV